MRKVVVEAFLSTKHFSDIRPYLCDTQRRRIPSGGGRNDESVVMWRPLWLIQPGRTFWGSCAADGFVWAVFETTTICWKLQPLWAKHFSGISSISLRRIIPSGGGREEGSRRDVWEHLFLVELQSQAADGFVFLLELFFATDTVVAVDKHILILE